MERVRYDIVSNIKDAEGQAPASKLPRFRRTMAQEVSTDGTYGY